MIPHANVKQASALDQLLKLSEASLVELRSLQARTPGSDAPRWLELALAAGQPGDHAALARALPAAMMWLGDENYGTWKDPSGKPWRWWADSPEWHLARVGVCTLHALGRSDGTKLPELPADPDHDAYAACNRLAQQWLRQRAEHLTRLNDHPTHAVPRWGPSSLNWGRWGIPPDCQTLGPAFDINVLLAAGPEVGALARLRLQAVCSEGAWLTLAPVPASACLLLDADFGQMLTDLRDWLRSSLTGYPSLHPLRHIALAWDLAPAVGERIGLDAVSGDSAGAAFACAALQVLSAYTTPVLRTQLALARHRMGNSFMSAAITPQGGVRPVGWVNAKTQAIAPLARWADRLSSPGLAPTQLYLAQGQKDLDQLPACFDAEACTTVEALVQAIARNAESLSRIQQAFLEAWYTPTPVAPADDTPTAEEGTWPLDEGDTPYADASIGPELSERLLNPLVDRPADHPVATLRQAAIQGVARWQRQAGGRLRHQFVPLSVSPEEGRRFGLQESLEARTEPHEHLQPLLAELDHGAHKAYLLTGLPGAGKTVLLRRHMLDLCSQLLQSHATAEGNGEPLEVPIYLPLNRFPSNNPTTPADDPATADWWADQARTFVLKRLREQGWQEPMLAPFFNAVNGADTPGIRWRWHIDALNELPMPPDDPDQDRGDRARWVVQGFLDAFKPALKPLLSVRSAHFQDESWLTVEVLPWEPRHIKAYLRKFFAQAPRTGQALWNALVQDASLMDLCRRPMHLHMQCELAAAGFSRVASDRATLYLAHLWLRLKRGLGQFDGKEQEDDHLRGNDLLTVEERRTIKNLRLDQVNTNDLRRLPLQGLLVRGLLDQAESQYWQDAEEGRQAGERCKVALELDYSTLHGIALRHADGQPVRDPTCVRRWLRAGAALGLLQTNPGETSLEFSHQSWGEFFASLRLLDTPPDELERQVKAGVTGARDKWDRAMVRPFKHLDERVSAETERQALRERVNRRWAPVLPRLQRFLAQNQGRLSVDMATLKADASVNMPEADDAQVVQRHTANGWVGAGLLEFPEGQGIAVAHLDRWMDRLGISAAVGLAPGAPWATDGAACQALLVDRLWSCFEEQVWAHLRQGDESGPGLNDEAEQLLRQEPGHLALPATSDVQEVLQLALQSLTQKQAEAWLAHWLTGPPHPQAWRVLVPAALALRARLEPPDAPGVAGLGMWHKPRPLLQHLRRWLLLASVDAGQPARERVQAAGVWAALQAPIGGLPAAIEATWASPCAAAFAGEGLDLLLRLQAGLLLGELGDNIRYERVSVEVDGRERVGIRLKAAHWAAIPASGPQATHRIGDTRWDNSQPVWPAPAGALPACRFAHSPAVVMQWQAYADDLQARGEPVPHLWAMGRSRWSNPLQPVTTLDWFTAQHFTAWMAPLHKGLFPELDGAGEDQRAQLALPTEVQHEAAVRFDAKHPHPERQAKWPHDASDTREPDQMPPDLFNHNRTRWGAPAPVGVFSAALTPTGIEAMGNVWTWCANVYTGDYQGDNARLANQPYTVNTPEEWRERAQAASEDPHLLALRGGSCNLTAVGALVACRNHDQPDNGNGYFGLRWVMCRPIC